jgi:hypothetical protein
MESSAAIGARDRGPNLQPPEGIEQFELLRCLGAGTSGTVWEARERATSARVALKLLRQREGLNLLHFKREFRTLADLAHPNIVRFGGLYEEAGHFYFTMELVDGEQFLDHVRAPVLDMDRLRAAFGQLTSGLIALHAAGLVHRDVKPQNILVTRSGRVVLLDFGLALSLEHSRHCDSAGTIAYMAPEQALTMDHTPAVDWYAMGVILYDALTGKLPSSHRGMRNFLAEARGTLMPPSALVSDIPEDLSELCIQLLRFEPKDRPDEETIMRHFGSDAEHARGRASFRSQVSFRRGVFVARTRELEVLHGARRQMEQGSLSVVRIEGESGIGKSALLRQFVTDVATDSADTLIVSSRCYEREAVAYRAMDSVVDGIVHHLVETAHSRGSIATPVHAAYLAQVFPVTRALPGFEGLGRPGLLDVDPHEARRRAYDALRALLRTVTDRCPLVIHVDDAQWMDRDSVALLSYLLSEQPSRTLVVVTSRPTMVDPLESVMQSVPGAVRLELSALSPGESERLATLLLGDAVGVENKRAASVARESAGHPLHILELVTHTLRGAPAVGSLEDAMSERVLELDASARHLLGLIGIATAPLDDRVARSASGLSAAAYQGVVSRLREEGLVSFNAASSGDDLQVYHDRVRQVVVGRMPSESRRDAHRVLALSIERYAPNDLDALAHHFAEAAVPEAAARYASRAGDQSLDKLAFENAAHLFEMALRFEGQKEARGSLESRLGRALASAGRGAAAAAAYLRAAPLSGAAMPDLRRRAGEQLLRAGHVDDGTSILFALLRELGTAAPESTAAILASLGARLFQLRIGGLSPRNRARPLSPNDRLKLDVFWTLATGLSTVHHLRATEFQARALTLALRAGDTDRVVKAAALLGATLSMTIGWPRSMSSRLRQRATDLAKEFPSDENAGWLDLAFGVTCLGHWDFIGCETSCARAEQILTTRCTGVAWEIATAQAFGLWSASFRGNFSEAGARLPGLLESARSRGDRHAETALILSPLHLVGLAANRPTRVRQECEEAMAMWPATVAPFQHMCGAYVLAQVDLYEGRAEDAWTHALRAREMLRRSHLSSVEFQRVDLSSLRARAALACAAGAAVADRKRWLEEAMVEVRRLRREAVAPAHAFADLIDGAVMNLRADGATAKERLASASRRFESLGMKLHAGTARLGCAAISHDHMARTTAERDIAGLGVVDVPAMTRVWLPGLREASI